MAIIKAQKLFLSDVGDKFSLTSKSLPENMGRMMSAYASKPSGHRVSARIISKDYVFPSTSYCVKKSGKSFNTFIASCGKSFSFNLSAVNKGEALRQARAVMDEVFAGNVIAMFDFSDGSSSAAISQGSGDPVYSDFHLVGSAGSQADAWLNAIKSLPVTSRNIFIASALKRNLKEDNSVIAVRAKKNLSAFKMIASSMGRVVTHLTNAVKGEGTVGIFTAIQSMGKGSTVDEAKNKKNYQELGNILNNLLNGPIAMKGMWQGEAEDSYLVPDIPLPMLKTLNARYKQWAFIYAGPETDGNFQFWATDDPSAGPESYEMVSTWNNYAVAGLKEPEGYTALPGEDNKFSFYEGGDTPQEYITAVDEMNSWVNQSIDVVKVTFAGADRPARIDEKHSKLKEQVAASKKVKASVFVLRIEGDNSYPFWDVFYDPETEMADFESSGFSAPSVSVEELGVDPNQGINAVISDLEDHYQEQRVVASKKEEVYDDFGHREDVGKYNTVEKVKNVLGRRPSEQEVAEFVINNFYDVTERERGEDDARSHDKIADLVGYYKFDIDSWLSAWESVSGEAPIVEGSKKVKAMDRGSEVKVYDFDEGDDPSDVRESDKVVVGGKEYICDDILGDNYNLKLRDEKGDFFIYRGESNETQVEPFSSVEASKKVQSADSGLDAKEEAQKDIKDLFDGDLFIDEEGDVYKAIDTVHERHLDEVKEDPDWPLGEKYMNEMVDELMKIRGKGVLAVKRGSYGEKMYRPVIFPIFNKQGLKFITKEGHMDLAALGDAILRFVPEHSDNASLGQAVIDFAGDSVCDFSLPVEEVGRRTRLYARSFLPGWKEDKSITAAVEGATYTADIGISGGNYDDIMSNYREMVDKVSDEEFYSNPTYDEDLISQDLVKIEDAILKWVENHFGGKLENMKRQSYPGITGTMTLTQNIDEALAFNDREEGTIVYQAEADFFEEGFLDSLNYKEIYMLGFVDFETIYKDGERVISGEERIGLTGSKRVTAETKEFKSFLSDDKIIEEFDYHGFVVDPDDIDWGENELRIGVTVPEDADDFDFSGDRNDDDDGNEDDFGGEGNIELNHQTIDDIGGNLGFSDFSIIGDGNTVVFSNPKDSYFFEKKASVTAASVPEKSYKISGTQETVDLPDIDFIDGPEADIYGFIEAMSKKGLIDLRGKSYSYRMSNNTEAVQADLDARAKESKNPFVLLVLDAPTAGMISVFDTSKEGDHLVTSIFPTGDAEIPDNFEKVMETSEFIYYGDPEESDDNGNTIIVNKSDGRVLSDNIFATNSFFEDLIAGDFTWLSDSVKAYLPDMLEDYDSSEISEKAREKFRDMGIDVGISSAPSVTGASNKLKYDDLSDEAKKKAIEDNQYINIEDKPWDEPLASELEIELGVLIDQYEMERPENSEVDNHDPYMWLSYEDPLPEIAKKVMQRFPDNAALVSAAENVVKAGEEGEEFGIVEDNPIYASFDHSLSWVIWQEINKLYLTKFGDEAIEETLRGDYSFNEDGTLVEGVPV